MPNNHSKNTELVRGATDAIPAWFSERKGNHRRDIGNKKSSDDFKKNRQEDIPSAERHSKWVRPSE